MENLILKFREEVIFLASKSEFVNSKWYVKYHLEIVEKIAMELCDLYPNADRNLVKLLVWLHDLGKILGLDNNGTLIVGKKKLMEIGLPGKIIDQVIVGVKAIDEKIYLETALIEVKIVSSADGAAHLIGPFFLIWFYENPNRPINELMEKNIQKVRTDLEKKIVLPEVKEVFLHRYNLVLEQNGIFPDKYL